LGGSRATRSSVVQESTGGHLQSLGDIEQALLKQATPPVLDVNQDVTGDP
jgi:hypothetical protein